MNRFHAVQFFAVILKIFIKHFQYYYPVNDSHSDSSNYHAGIVTNCSRYELWANEILSELYAVNGNVCSREKAENKKN